jgi:transposase
MERVPWAYPKSGFLKAFEYQVAYNAAFSTAKLVMENFRIHQESVGRICKRVFEHLGKKDSNFDNLKKIGIDETSYKKGHKYLTVVINLETNQVIWIDEGYGKSVLCKFFKLLTEKQLSSIKLVTADGARYISDLVTEYLPNAERCIDTFHVIGWANEKLDEVRRRLTSETQEKISKKK